MVGDYYYGTGRRKSAVARVFLKPGKGGFSGITWSDISGFQVGARAIWRRERAAVDLAVW